MRIARRRSEDIIDDPEVSSQLRFSVGVQQGDPILPRCKYTVPFRFSVDRAFDRDILFLDKSEATREIFRIVIGIVPRVHRSEQFLEVDVAILDDGFPNRSCKRLGEVLCSHPINDSINLFLVGAPETPGSPQVGIIKSSAPKLLKMWCCFQNR